MSDEYIDPPAKAADLTERQLVVASMIARHFTDQQIAAELGITDSTVRTHIVGIAYRIHANPARVTRTQIAEWWWRQTPDIPRAA